MFNKPTMFPKNGETHADRGLRPGQGGSGLTGGALSSVSAATAVRDNPPSDTTDTKASVSTQPAADAGQATGSSLIVGPDVKLKGAEILDCDTLVVEGRVEATMDSRVIRIAQNGSYSGTVGIDVAEVHGVFEGELTARKQLIIHATGRVSGKIRYGKILIEEGGEISGDVKSLAAAGKESGKPVEKFPAEAKPLAAVAG
ncbi:bactofilin family protein [Thauera sinica]|uniref:Polymer-forming cytoskeletal protein n=1 Tax=Thauera sinica TaxID=2665146 RepID=A0ABW1ALH6_9RHOO|nr:polymer-forming cytoskeletal protein [Thauera sp. K11]ATE60819.1 cell shape determination protein CcmA [Thauera sp. K11]